MLTPRSSKAEQNLYGPEDQLVKDTIKEWNAMVQTRILEITQDTIVQIQDQVKGLLASIG